MNGHEPPAVASSGVFSSYSNGHGSASPEPPKNKAKSGAKALYEQRKHFTKTSINGLTDTSQYHVEHLTTFVLDRKDGMITVDDGVRRLRLLDAKGKVWTQEMLLQVEEKTVSLVDQETKNELENFPVGTIQHCQAVMNACSYDSILALVCKDSGQSKPDLHLFQCDDIKANLIHADIESAMIDAKGGKVKKRPETLKMILKSDGVIPPPPAAPAPEPPASSNQVDVKSRAAAWSAWTNEQQDYERQRQMSEEDGPVEMSAARVDRDVQILNHVLDDIEFFVTRLQKAAEAFSELAKRKKVKKAKKKGPGEGVLTLRSRPPGDDEFVDCLQKFKHAFNQLGKLKDHIQNPSAVDLLHFLFSPLRMVVQAWGSVDLARSVLVPLLTRDAIDFLHAAGTAEERHLWVALGDGWTKSRLEWPKEHFFPPCVLTFRDGWEPPLLAAAAAAAATPSRELDLDQLTEGLAYAETQRHEDLRTQRHEDLRTQRHEDLRTQRHEDLRTQRHEDLRTQRHEDLRTQRHEDLRTQRHEDLRTQRHEDLRTQRHEDLRTQRHEDLRTRLEQAAVQKFPPADGYAFNSYKHLQILDQDSAMAAFKQAVSHHVDRFDVDGRVQPNLFAKSKYDFVARNNTELSVLKDEVVEVLDDRKQWWKVRNGGGASGYVPNNILEITKAVDMTGRGEPIYSHTIQLMMPKKEFELFKKQTTRTDFIPSKPVATPMPPPPTPPPPAPARLPTPPLPPPAAEPAKLPAKSSAVSRQNSTTSSDNGSVAMRDQNNQRPPPVNRRKSNMEEVQDELMHRLTLGRSAQKKFQVSSRSCSGLPSNSITYDSSPEDVKAWLEAKGFSPVTITSLGVLTGAQLFSLNKEELKTVCPDDGARVFSQVTVQKAALEKSSGSELQEIMRRRQEKLAASTCDSGVESFDEGSAH